MIFPPQGVAKSITSADIVAGTIVNSDISSSAAIAGSKIAVLGSEINSTPVAGGNDTVSGANTRHYTFFTLPSTATFYMITAIEWLNGTVVANTMTCGIEYVDASPPVSASMCIAAWGSTLAQAGAEAVQKHTRIASTLIPGGTLLAAYVSNSGATGRIGTTTVSSNNNQKSVSGTPVHADQTAWTATTEEPYIKVYYKPVL